MHISTLLKIRSIKKAYKDADLIFNEVNDIRFIGIIDMKIKTR